MPGWKDVSEQVRATGRAADVVRRQHLRSLSDLTGRNVIVYYSGWLQKQGLGLSADALSITDADKSGFMATVHNMDRNKGLDLVLHTPGGDLGATESLVDYLRSMFGTNIRAIIPQLSLSCGTMIACACEIIIMGKHSSIGPIDPQFNGVPAHGVIEEFERAKNEIIADPRTVPVWQPIIGKYHPTFVGECEYAITWSSEMVMDWLKTGMFKGDSDAEAKAQAIVAELGSHRLTKAHNRHISAQRAAEIGLRVEMLEENQDLQDAILSVHHCCVQTLADSTAYKLIENQDGMAVVSEMLPV